MDHSQRHATSRIRVAALAGVAVLVIASCTSGSTAAPSGAPASASAAPSASPAASAGTGAMFTYGSHTQVVTDLDPATSYSNEVIAMHNVYETLTRYDAASQSLKPALATSWTSSADGMTWTFTLRPGVTFHTGRAMDATAAKAAIERTMTLGQGAGYIWGVVKSIETPDPQTLVFTLELPGAARPHRLGELRRLHLRHAGRRCRRDRRRPRRLVQDRQGCRDGPVHDLDLEGGRRVRADPRQVRRVLGRLGRQPLHAGRVPGRAGGHHGRAAGPVRRPVLCRSPHAPARSRA